MRSGSKPRPFLNSHRGYIFSYESNLPIDYYLKLCYKLRQPRSLRACSRDDPECGARRGALRRRLVTVARQALRPGCEELAARIRVMPETEARPRVKNRHGGAPRGERPALWQIFPPRHSMRLHWGADKAARYRRFTS